MTALRLHPAPAAVLGAALAATAAVFLFARPEYRPAVQVETVNLAAEPYSDVPDVMAAFRRAGINLGHRKTVDSTTWLGTTPGPWDESSLYVMVFPRSGTLGLGHDSDAQSYESRIGNVLVHYGGTSAARREAVEAAVASLRPARLR